MKLDGILLPEFADDLLGDESSRFNLERSATRTPEPTITLPEATGFSDSTGIVAEIEKSWLVEQLTGITVTDAQRNASAHGDFRKRAAGAGAHDWYKQHAPARAALRKARIEGVLPDAEMERLEIAAWGKVL
jgi:hypothetical protein